MDGGNKQRFALKFCFKAGLSATETLVLVQKAHGNEALNRSNDLRWYSRFLKRKGPGRRWVGWPYKIDSNWGKHCCSCWFGQKWQSNRIKNDNIIFEHLQDCSSSDSERGFGKEKVVFTFRSTLLDTWAKGRSSQILPRHYHEDRSRQKFFKQNYYGRWGVVFCL
jgi:hypothetical protein